MLFNSSVSSVNVSRDVSLSYSFIFILVSSLPRLFWTIDSMHQFVVVFLAIYFSVSLFLLVFILVSSFKLLIYSVLVGVVNVLLFYVILETIVKLYTNPDFLPTDYSSSILQLYSLLWGVLFLFIYSVVCIFVFRKSSKEIKLANYISLYFLSVILFFGLSHIVFDRLYWNSYLSMLGFFLSLFFFLWFYLNKCLRCYKSPSIN